MAVVAYWRTANTRPAVLIPLFLGTDPITGDVRTIVGTDVVSMIMRNGSNPAQLIEDLDVVTIDARTDDDGNTTTQAAVYKPEDGDLDEEGTYEVVFDITDNTGDVETIPDRVSVSYQFLVGVKPDAT